MLGQTARNVAFLLILGGILLSAPPIRSRSRLATGCRWQWSSRPSRTASAPVGSPAPLDDRGREDLRVIARRLLLSDDPVTEPVEIAQAGG